MRSTEDSADFRQGLDFSVAQKVSRHVSVNAAHSKTIPCSG